MAAFTFAPSSAVVSRIESLAESLVTELAEGRLPPLRLPSTASSASAATTFVAAAAAGAGK